VSGRVSVAAGKRVINAWVGLVLVLLGAGFLLLSAGLGTHGHSEGMAQRNLQVAVPASVVTSSAWSRS
jgi:hypothetical protein